MGFDLALGTIARGLMDEAEAWKAPVVTYGPRGGFVPLRQVLSRREDVEPECVVVTSGASMALTATLAILPKDRVVLVPRPFYPAYPNVARFLGLTVGFYDVAPGCPFAAAVAAVARGQSVGAILINTPGNPLGNVATRADLAAVEAIARDADALLIVDETYAGLVLDPAASAWSGSGAAPGSVRIKSLSKAGFLAGERIGYLVADASLAGDIEEAHWVLAMSPAVTAQTNAARALLEDTPERLVRLCARLRRSRDRAVAAVTRVTGLHVHPPTAGVFLWIVLTGARSTGPVISRRLRDEHGLIVMPGEACGQADPPAFRANFALPEGDATQAFEALGHALCRLGVVCGADAVRESVGG